MDKGEVYIKMSIKAWPYLKDLIDHNTIDWRQQGYCIMHNCLLKGDQECVPICPKWEEEYDVLWPDTDAQDELFKEDKLCEEERWIPLLYQDQLQGMVSEEIGLVARVHGLSNFLAKGLLEGFARCCETEEQLELAFVMKQRFNMTWDGKDWVGG